MSGNAKLVEAFDAPAEALELGKGVSPIDGGT